MEARTNIIKYFLFFCSSLIVSAVLLNSFSSAEELPTNYNYNSLLVDEVLSTLESGNLHVTVSWEEYQKSITQNTITFDDEAANVGEICQTFPLSDEDLSKDETTGIQIPQADESEGEKQGEDCECQKSVTMKARIILLSQKAKDLFNDPEHRKKLSSLFDTINNFTVTVNGVPCTATPEQIKKAGKVMLGNDLSFKFALFPLTSPSPLGYGLEQGVDFKIEMLTEAEEEFIKCCIRTVIDWLEPDKEQVDEVPIM